MKNKRTFVVQLLSHVLHFTTPWTAARQASLSFTISQSLNYIGLHLISSPSSSWVSLSRGNYQTSGGIFASHACEFHVYSSKWTYSLLEDVYPSVCQDNSRFHLKKERSEGTNIYQEPVMFHKFHFGYLTLLKPHWVLETLLHSLHNRGQKLRVVDIFAQFHILTNFTGRIWTQAYPPSKFMLFYFYCTADIIAI